MEWEAVDQLGSGWQLLEKKSTLLPPACFLEKSRTLKQVSYMSVILKMNYNNPGYINAIELPNSKI